MGNEHTLTNPTEQIVTVCRKVNSRTCFLFLEDGSVSGIPASLLNEGASRGLDVIILFVNTTTEADFHAATSSFKIN